MVDGRWRGAKYNTTMNYSHMYYYFKNVPFNFMELFHAYEM
jgi:hypothetical protein